MVDTARPANVQALRALFAQKEKTVIDALKAPKEISKEIEPSTENVDSESSSNNSSKRHSTASDGGSSSHSSSPVLSLKPKLGPKPDLSNRSPSPKNIKNLMARLERTDSMYTTSKSPAKNCDTQSTLIKKETILIQIGTNNNNYLAPDNITPDIPQKSPSLSKKLKLTLNPAKLLYRKRNIPSPDVLGPPPAKPAKLSPLAPPLPQRNEKKDDAPPPLPERVANVSNVPHPSVIHRAGRPPSRPPSRPPPPTPDTNDCHFDKCPPPPRPSVPPPTSRSPPPTVDLDCSDELYGDTVEPDQVKFFIPEYTEEEECGGRNSQEIICPPSYPPPTRPKNPPPPPPNLSPRIIPETISENSTIQEDIYEEMPIDEQRGPLYSNTKEQKEQEKKQREEQKRVKREQKEKEKHEKNCEKLRKKYGLTGVEIPVDAGTVKVDSKGNKTDLTVHKGETVLILRMENNPVGKWLAKNEKGKIGYVELNNIEVDAVSVKSVMTVRVSQAIEESIYSDIPNDDEDIYECTD